MLVALLQQQQQWYMAVLQPLGMQLEMNSSNNCHMLIITVITINSMQLISIICFLFFSLLYFSQIVNYSSCKVIIISVSCVQALISDCPAVEKQHLWEESHQTRINPHCQETYLLTWTGRQTSIYGQALDLNRKQLTELLMTLNNIVII